MVARGTPLPNKLKHDGIVEALLELRFESDTIPEVFLGRIIDHQYWRGFQQRRLPAYEIPAQLRHVVPNVRYAPIIELIGPDEKAALRFGPSVLSYHRTRPYVGWTNFKPELERVVETLFETTENISVNRLGFRYLNVLTPTLHQINSIADLDLKLTIANDELSTNVNVNLTTSVSTNSSCTVRIATKEFVQGVPLDTSVFIDVDVFTNEGFSTSDKAVVNAWVADAHAQEKTEFFHLFTPASGRRLSCPSRVRRAHKATLRPTGGAGDHSVVHAIAFLEANRVR